MFVTTGRSFLDVLKKTGLIPPNTRRVVIDASMDEVVQMYYECYGDATLLCVDTVESLKDCITVHVEDLSDK
jgi:hypothetical protein